ncbi:MAG: hypothetical protein KF884_01265 [Fimbriimonadaceae bacterium]|nr:hypothetical protein [Fimbriimonadaceae bacterium]QYK58726.1 MAG: hypothetical protein KF884_01265 [Fimbriimonadaceae bacterium]
MAKLKRTVIVGGLSGSSGPVTFKLTSEGTIVSERTSPSNPNTPAQQSARARFTSSARTYRGFSSSIVQQWDEFAESGLERDPVSGGQRFRDGINAYIGLASKFLQATPNGTPPTTPPTTPFVAPNVTLTATGSAGKVTFTAGGPTPANVRTELLLQKLAGANRKPQSGAYRSRAFAAFVPGSLSADVTVGPGFYAAAYRFVNTQTGQATELQSIGVAQVTLALSQGGKKAA